MTRNIPVWSLALSFCLSATDAANANEAYDQIEPILMELCYDCHGDGMDKGDFAMDDWDSIEEHLKEFDVWYEIWKQVRSNLMPPADKKQLRDEEKAELMAFIEGEVFQIDHENPDPGRVTIRRLNREEYKNTIKDIFRIDFAVNDILPPDDTGYGFDTIGDVLSISPLLMEKYLEAAGQIAAEVVPLDGPVITEWWLELDEFKDQRKKDWSVDWMPFNHARTMEANPWVSYDGEYEVRIEFRIKGSSRASSNTATLKVGVDDKELTSRTLGWDNSDKLVLKTKANLKRGTDQKFWLKTIEGEAPQDGEEFLAIDVDEIRIRGPLDGSHKDYPWHTRFLFSEGPPPEDENRRDPYRRKILKQVSTMAFRRPVDEQTLERLVTIARETDKQPGKRFEHGIEQAIMAILVSPRFLMRAEIQPEPDNPSKVVPIDEYSLASRLSYFLWSSCPDEELMTLAGEGKLRENLRPQVERMLRDLKSERFDQNFVGQWLQARDVQTIYIDERRALNTRSLSQARRTFSGRLRESMRRETEMLFSYVLRQNKPATELLTADYTFLNEDLANWYDVGGVEGRTIRMVPLPKDSPRGGLLNQATFQIVTSNPTRTSPVKRGLFVLENFLATPAPPAVPDVPPLEDAGKKLPNNVPLRKLMELHAEEKMCASCHMRMDPIGLALENFNQIGLWRDEEKGQPIDASGKLMTGEEFSNAKELSQILATDRRSDFHRALAEKLLTYAVGRGIEYFDAPTIDKIVAGAEAKDGSLKEILYGVIESAPFQKRRGDGGFSAAVGGE